jgi:hypothetical protein
MYRLFITLTAMTMCFCSFSQTNFLTEKVNIKQIREFENNLNSIFVGFDTTKVAKDYFQGAIEDRYYHPIKFKRTNDDFFPELFVTYYYDETSLDSMIICASYDWNIMNYVRNLNDDGYHFDNEVKREVEYFQKYTEINEDLIEKFGKPRKVEEAKEANGYFYRLNWDNKKLDILVIFQFSTEHKSIGNWKVGSYSIRVKFNYT